MKKLWALLMALVFVLGGCGLNLSLFGEGDTKDKIEVGIYNSLRSTAAAYGELAEYLGEHEHLFDEAEKQKIEESAAVYRNAYHAAIETWMTYKLHGDDASLDKFVLQATTAIGAFNDLYNLVEGDDGRQ